VASLFTVEEDGECPHNPHHFLLLNILDRALRDLIVSESHIRVEAINWFSQWRNTTEDDAWISFKDVCDYLDLSLPILAAIEEKVDRARLRRKGSIV
jgi:hypothetical protein